MFKVLPCLPNLQVINFGDCLVKSKGAMAIAEALKHGHWNLKVYDNHATHATVYAVFP